MKKHWLQTPEGKKRMSEIQQKRWAKKRRQAFMVNNKPTKSRAETLVVKHKKEKASGPAPELIRMQSYIKIVGTAIKHNELRKLVEEIQEQVLQDAFRVGDR